MQTEERLFGLPGTWLVSLVSLGARNYRSKAVQLGFAGEVDLEVGFD